MNRFRLYWREKKKTSLFIYDCEIFNGKINYTSFLNLINFNTQRVPNLQGKIARV